MAESSTPVRLLQHHLRQSGTLLAAGQLDAAAEHLDAALAIDPASLAALTLREKLAALRASNGRPAANSRPVINPRPAVDPGTRANALAPTAEPTPAPATGRFVPTGVDVASWSDFEQRVQQRRFRALIEAGERALSSGDLTSARSALEEAREFQPDSLEVARLSIRLAATPVAAANAKREGVFRSRTFRAASLLLLGVSLLMGLDWVRSEQEGAQSNNTPTVGTGGLNVEDTAAANEQAELASAAPVVENPDSTSPEPRVAEPVDVATAALTTVPAARPVTVPSAEAARSVPAGETPDFYVALPANRTASNAITTPPRVNGEIPDDYVAPARRAATDVRDAAPVVPAGRAGTPTPIANVARQPVVVEGLGTSAGPSSSPPPAPVVSPAPVAPSAAAGAAAIVPVVSEDARVRAVVDQYARAYGRLDVSAVRAVWPTVDEKGLAKAFSDLSSQSMSFENCEIAVAPQSGAATAKALCHGRTTYVRKVGNREQRTESRTVQFDLKLDGNTWKIQKTQTGR